jgi:hypothetical protein
MSSPGSQFRIGEIDVSRLSTDERIAGIFRLDQGTGTQRNASLLIVADINSSLYVYERLLDVLNATADQARHLVAGVNLDPVARFEKLVQRLNESVATFIEQEATAPQWTRVNVFVLELSEGHLCFTGTGKLMNAFFQKQEDESFKAFDLLGSLEQPEEVDPKKPFASIVCGDVKPGDTLIIGTQNLERLRSELQIKDRLTTLPPITAALDIQHDLEKRNIPDHFVAAVISCTELKQPEPFVPATKKEEAPEDKSTASIEKLRSAEKEAESHLAAKISPVPAGNPLSSLRDKIGGMMPKKNPSRPPDPVALASLRSMNAGYGSFFTMKRKLALVGIVVAVIASVSGFAWWRHAQRLAGENALWNATFDSATDQRNRAESDLIYGNDLRAKSEIATAEQNIKSLPTDTPDRKTKIAKMTSDLLGLRDRLKKIVKQENVIELTSTSGADNSLTAPVLVGDNAYVADNTSGNIVKISLTTKTPTQIPLPSGFGQIISGSEDKAGIVFTTANGKLLSVNKTTNAVTPLAWKLSKTSSMKDVIVYGSKLFSLDPNKNQVWKSSAVAGGYGPESAYIKATSAPLSDAISMAIDSNVYVLKNDGTVLKFLSGGQEGFALATIDPPLRAAGGIWTIADGSTIVVTDPADKRVITFDKNGTLTAQIQSSHFTAPRDVAADEANKRMILTDGNKLLLVPMP